MGRLCLMLGVVSCWIYICESNYTFTYTNHYWNYLNSSESNTYLAQPKRTESAKLNNIQLLDTPESRAKQTESEKLKNTKYDKYGSNDKNVYEKYTQYGKYGQKSKYDQYDRADKYDKADKHDKADKYDKYDKYDKSKKNSGCEIPEKKTCVAIYATLTGTNSVVITKSIHGSPLELASTYVKENQESINIFSNRARGSYSKEYDIGLVYGPLTNEQYLVRGRYDGEQINIIYESDPVSASNSNPGYAPFVTDLSKSTNTMNVDAYSFFSPTPTANVPFKHFLLYSKTGDLAEMKGLIGGCFDISFYDEDDECTRWICVSDNPETTLYLRDPFTGTDYIPPEDNNPLNLIPFRIWATGGRFCGQNYVAIFGANNDGLQIVRAKTSRKYPYFKDAETVSIFQFVPGPPIGQIYSPPDKDIILACFLGAFWRFDNAYTGAVPMTPTIMTVLPAAPCVRIVSFTECSDEIYISTFDALLYSSNGGRSFQFVNPGPFDISPPTSLTGFAVKDYKKASY